MLRLTLNPEGGITRNIAAGTTAVSIDVVVEETDVTLPFQLVDAAIDWNDGQQPVVYSDQAAPLVLMGLARNLGVGVYAVTVTASNNRAPTPDTIKAVLPITISQMASGVPQRIIFGPVLPRDDGFPNAQTWLFDMGSDLQLLQSSVKMLLITVKGERVMLPTYGTNIRRMIFELNVASVEAIVQQEVSQAINQFEPRVTLRALQVQRLEHDPRAVNVYCSFLSRVNGQPFDLNLQFAQ